MIDDASVAALELALKFCNDTDADPDEVLDVAERFRTFLNGEQFGAAESAPVAPPAPVPDVAPTVQPAMPAAPVEVPPAPPPAAPVAPVAEPPAPAVVPPEGNGAPV